MYAGSDSARPARDVEPGSVARADGNALVAVELALAQRPVVVRAAILEPVQRTTAVVDADREQRPGRRRFAPCRAAAPRAGRPRSPPPSVERDVHGRRTPLLRQRRALCLVQRHLQHAEPEQCALETHGGQRDADLLQQLVLLHRRHVLGPPALDEIGQHRGRRLADRAAAALEADLLDHVALAESHRDRDLVAAQRVLALGERVARAPAARGSAGVL